MALIILIVLLRQPNPFGLARTCSVAGCIMAANFKANGTMTALNKCLLFSLCFIERQNTGGKLKKS